MTQKQVKKLFVQLLQEAEQEAVYKGLRGLFSIKFLKELLLFFCLLTESFLIVRIHILNVATLNLSSIFRWTPADAEFCTTATAFNKASAKARVMHFTPSEHLCSLPPAWGDYSVIAAKFSGSIKLAGTPQTQPQWLSQCKKTSLVPEKVAFGWEYFSLAATSTTFT